MSEQTAEATATETDPSTTDQTETKPTETVDFWKQKAREQEKRAKVNADAAKRLAEIEDAQKSESQKAADRIAQAEAEVASIPGKVAEVLKTHLVTLHQIDADKADLFLTANDPDLLLRQVNALVADTDTRQQKNNVSPREGTNHSAPEDEALQTVRGLFGGS